MAEWKARPRPIGLPYGLDFNSDNGADFRGALLRWFRTNRRDLPWRQTHDSYAILVSEFMLQQTQVATVIPYYREWLRRFPDFETLAAASESDVLHSWQGLGYYARARNLHAAAKIVARDHAGVLPRSVEAMRHLPGVGRYTANAIASFAWEEALPVVEANIARLLARVFDLREPIDAQSGRNALWSYAALLMPKTGASAHNAALMDLGALVCTSRLPKCGVCPVKDFCQTTTPMMLPIKKSPAKVELSIENHGFAFRGNRVLLEQSSDRWRGMWILPRLALQPAGRPPIHTAEFPFTNHRIMLTVFDLPRGILPRPYGDEHRWFPVDAIESIPLPSPHRRALRHLLAREFAKA